MFNADCHMCSLLYWINLLKYVLVLTTIEREPAMEDCYLDNLYNKSSSLSVSSPTAETV